MKTIEKNNIINAVIFDLGIMLRSNRDNVEVSKYLKRKATELEGDNVRDNSNVIFISNVSNELRTL